MINKKTKNAIRRDYMASPERPVNQLKAFRRGKNVVVTIPNPDPEQTNKRFIKVNGKEYFRSETAPKKKETVVDASQTL